MKYRQLTKEQLESLHDAFAKFLATQSIDAKEWETITKEKPAVATEELGVFSDMVWEDVLNKTKYIEHFSKTSINLFKCKADVVYRIVVQVDWEIDLFSKQGFEWLMQNPTDNSVTIYKGNKKYVMERNLELFDLIEKGGIISKGEIFEYFHKLITT